MVTVMEFGKFKRGIHLVEQQDITCNYHRRRIAIELRWEKSWDEARHSL